MAADKNKYTIWMHPETWEKVKELYKEAGCPRKSDFIEQAIRFYVGYLTAENKANFLPNMFLSNMKSIVRESDNRNSKMLFKFFSFYGKIV